MLLRLGATGPAVAEVRARLAHLGFLDPDGRDAFDEATDAAVRAFQQERGLNVDGIVGPETYRRLEEARWQLGDRVLRYVPVHLMHGDDVTDLQRRLNQLGFDAGRPDGLFGPKADAAVREFQRSVGVTADGTCGPETFRAFERLVRAVSGGNASSLRDRIAMDDLQTGVSDKIVVIDPGVDIGADICEAIAIRVEGRLAALGTQAVLTRSHGSQRFADDRERAGFANQINADLLVSIQCDESPSPHANGVATFYFGDPLGGVHSYSGRKLAEQIQGRICTSSECLDCRSHPRTWDILRMTRMPAVRIVVGYVSNPVDAQRLSGTAHQDHVAEAIAEAVTEFCAPSVPAIAEATTA